MELTRVRQFKVTRQAKSLIVRIPGELAEDMNIDETCNVDWLRIAGDNKRVVLEFTRNGETSESDDASDKEESEK